MTQQTVPGAPEPKRRGVGFPQMSLRDAVEAIVLIGQHGPNHSHDAAAAYLGHSTANSGAFRAKLASLRDWGLLDRGDKDRVMLSELAQQLVLDVSPDHDHSQRLLLTAFESCRVFGMVYADSAKNTPLDVQRVRTTVVMRHGVATDQADKFVESFIDSVGYAGLGKFDGSRLTLLPRDTVFDKEDGVIEAGVDVGDATVPSSSVRGSTTLPTPVVSAPAIPIALRQAWPIDGGEIEFIIRTDEALPPSIWGLVAKMAEVADEMKRKLTRPLIETMPGANLPMAYRTPETGSDPTGN